MRAAPGDYPIDDSESDITALMWNGVGGGTIVYAAQWQRNMPSDFRVRSLDGVADDWPLTYEDLEPYYVRVERDFGISGLAGDTAFPPGEGPPLPPVPLGAMGRKVAKAHNELGWHWWPAPMAIATRKYGALNPCVQRATCLKACADGAKATRRPHALAEGDRARRRAAHAGARPHAHDAAGRARRRRDLRRRRRQRARGQARAVTILCANGIGTPRLLLLSGVAGGLANSLRARRQAADDAPVRHGRRACSRTTSDPRRARGASTCTRSSSTRPTPTRGFVRGAKWGLQPTGGPIVDDHAHIRGAPRTRSGATASTTTCASARATRRCGASSPRTCRRSTTASSSTRSTPTGRACRRRRSSTG